MQRDTARFLLERTPEVAGLSLSADLEAADTCDQAEKLQTGQLDLLYWSARAAE